MLSIFRRRYTPARLAAALAADLPDDYHVTYDNQGLAVMDAHGVAAYVELRNGKAAAVAFSVDLPPAFAAEIALHLRDILPTYVDVENGFVAEQLEDVRTAPGVH